MKIRKILSIIPLLSLSLLTIVSCQACSNQTDKISFLDTNIASKLNLYDEFGESKIVQEYGVNQNNEVSFNIDTNLTSDYDKHNYKELNFNNIAFDNLFDNNNFVFANAKTFVTNVLKIKHYHILIKKILLLLKNLIVLIIY
ncbi:hypothetical protein [Spiroplasma endosymbiont of Nebria brevicollis]|uniref:hypothetical protein n=1 Tax=Spiroplasma endosymbiont of Nebria brevicollis TaxID=3066284 RepID=UPI00313E61CF